MRVQHPGFEFANVVLVNDERTPFEFVVQMLRLVFGKTEREAREIAGFAGWLGRSVCATYPVAAAKTLIEEAARYAEWAGHPLRLDLESLKSDADQGETVCSFCGKKHQDVRYLHAGKQAHICDACIIAGAQRLSAGVPSQRCHYAHELLAWHFAACPKEEIVTSSRLFPERMRADLQRATETLFASAAMKTVGIHGGHDFEPLTVAALMHNDRNAKTIGPLQYQDIDIGDEAPVKCLVNALWLLNVDGVPQAVLMARYQDYMRRTGITIEVAAPAGEAAANLAECAFSALEAAINEAACYRGKVLSLEQVDMYSGMAAGIYVHRLPTVPRSEIVLPEETLTLIERNVVLFARQRAALRRLGQSTKKGLLFHGPPGTGKTHTIRYLAGSLPGHTTLLITAEQVGLLQDYFTLARLLQPAVMVIEDADLIARDRGEMTSPCEEVLLNKLLNEMDGLRQDAEIFFILTTNRPDMLEAALAARPGRIDQAIAFPLPDGDGRRKLIGLYAKGVDIEPHITEEIVAKTPGVSAAFIKELMRRIAQYSLERDGRGKVAIADVAAATEEMLFAGGKLNRALLGGAADAS